jgi:DNA-binding transcriptional ArsR family regulator
MTIPHPLPEELAELIARRFRVLGDPLRVRLLDVLRDGEQTVNALAEHLGAGQQNVSKHLSVLTDAGMVARRKEGTYVYYRIADEAVFALCEQICGGLQSQLSTLAAVVGGETAAAAAEREPERRPGARGEPRRRVVPPAALS